MVVILDCVHVDRENSICVKNIKECLNILDKEYKCVEIDNCSTLECHSLVGEIIYNNWPVIISGSYVDVNGDYEWLNNLNWMLNLLIQANVPILGICFGGQIIFKQFYPDKLKLNDFQEDGPTLIQLNDKDVTVFQSHSDAMIYDNYDDIHVLGTSVVNDAKIIQMFKLRSKNIWGTQFHPEVEPRHLEIFKLIL